MHHPQPLGIAPLPAGYLVLPAGAAAEAVAPILLRGQRPEQWPAALRFYQAALDQDLEGALAALSGDDSALARYNRFVLQSDPATLAELQQELHGDLAALLALVGYTLGWIDQPPAATSAHGEICANILIAHAAQAFEQGDPAQAEALLQQAIDAARHVSPLLAGQLLSDLGQARQQRVGGDAGTIQIYREALRMLQSTNSPIRAQVALQLGLLYHEQARGQRPALLEAVKCYQEALRFYSRSNQPEIYAQIQSNLALAYLAMPLTEASDQLRMGIGVQALREALTIYTPEHYPEQWASTQLNLANALQYLPSAHPQDHLIEAVELYEAILQSPVAPQEPIRRARLLANQGNALAHLGIFDHARSKLSEAELLFQQVGDHESASAVAHVLEQAVSAAWHVAECG